MEKEPNNKSKRTGTQGSFSNLDLPNAKEGNIYNNLCIYIYLMFNF